MLEENSCAAYPVLSSSSFPCSSSPPSRLTCALRKTGDDWPKLLGPSDNSESREKGIITNWPAKGLRIIWQAKLGVGYSPPTISRGRIFLFDAYPDAVKRIWHQRLTCRESETGKELWKFEYESDYDDYFGYDNGPRCSPIVDGDRVYLHGVDGIFHCLNVQDGKPLWKVNTFSRYLVLQNFFGVGSCPVIYKDLVIVPIGGCPQGTPADVEHFMARKGNGTCLVAFDKFTGKEKYRLGDELASYSSPIIARIKGKPLGLYFARGGLVGFDPATGKQSFHYPWRARTLECVNAATPLVVGDNVLISECYGVGSCLLENQDRRGGRNLDRRRQGPRRQFALSLEHAHRGQRLHLCLLRPPYQRSRVALR